MRSYSQLTYQNRGVIYRGLCGKLSHREIAKLLGKDHSTISREIKRNSDEYGYMYAGQAHESAKGRRGKKGSKIDKHPKLRVFIIRMLKKRWSPRTIAGRWNLKNKIVKISAETIYRWIYGPEGEKLGLKKFLIRTRKKRGIKRKIKPSKIKDKVSVHQRPESINKREEIGHFEGDLMFNQGSQSENVFTLTDRVTKQAIMIKNKSKHSSVVITALRQYIKQTGIVIKSVTFDNGSEFSEHNELKNMGIDTYFCDPGSPWQKGSIENFNGIARRYLPFNMLAHDVTPEYIQKVSNLLNNMPRASLGFRTPLEFAREMNRV